MQSPLTAMCLLGLLALASAAYSGDGTAYSVAGDKDATGKNACGFGKLDSQWERMYGAMNHEQFPGSCDKCVRVRGTQSGASGESFLVKIVDECPECKHGDIDFSTAALEAITGFSWDRKKISWEWADCSGETDARSSEQVDEPSSDNQDGQDSSSSSSDSGNSDSSSSSDVQCEGGRKACSDDKLLSDGYICMNRAETKCCKKPNGKDCTPVDSRRRMQRRLLR
ncbi:hypothetical protein ABPG75_003702 [Micractinium tetrahymenae]